MLRRRGIWTGDLGDVRTGAAAYHCSTHAALLLGPGQVRSGALAVITRFLGRHLAKENLMPWSSEGGNGGSWKPGSPGPWGQKPGAPPPEFEEFLKRAQEKLKQWMPGPGGMGGRGLLALALVGTIVWLLSPRL